VVQGLLRPTPFCDVDVTAHEDTSVIETVMDEILSGFPQHFETPHYAPPTAPELPQQFLPPDPPTVTLPSTPTIPSSQRE